MITSRRAMLQALAVGTALPLTARAGASAAAAPLVLSVTPGRTTGPRVPDRGDRVLSSATLHDAAGTAVGELHTDAVVVSRLRSAAVRHLVTHQVVLPGGTIVATGTLPGTATAVTGGTGTYAGRTGVLHLTADNPHPDGGLTVSGPSMTFDNIKGAIDLDTVVFGVTDATPGHAGGSTFGEVTVTGDLGGAEAQLMQRALNGALARGVVLSLGAGAGTLTLSDVLVTDYQVSISDNGNARELRLLARSFSYDVGGSTLSGTSNGSSAVVRSDA